MNKTPTHSDPDGLLAPMDLALGSQPSVRATASAQVGEAATALLERLGCSANDRVEISGGVPLFPILDVPLRDPSIARGPDGLWWLTGTSLPSDDADPRQVHLWSSHDLVQWKHRGAAWNLANLPEEAGWMRFRRLTGDGRPARRAIQAPEISYHRGAWWMALSVNSQGTALLRCEGDDPTGEWRHHARITTRGGDASLFVDDDGTAWWLLDGGWIAPLEADWRRLAQPPCLLQPEPHSSLGDSPTTVGSWGARMVKVEGRYLLTAADHFGRLGEQACADTFAAVAATPAGPFSRRRLIIPHGDAACLFPDGRGGWQAVISPTDSAAALVDRPCLVPLMVNADNVASPRGDWAERTGMAGGQRVPEPVRVQHWPWSILERVPRSRYQPIHLPGVDWIRDPQITTGPDGCYYFTGTTSRVGLPAPGLRLWRSRNLTDWEPMGDRHGVVWYADTWDWCRKPQVCRWAPASGRSHRLWGGALTFHGGWCYLSFQMSFGGSGLLRSRDPAAPWEHWWYLDQIGIGLGLFLDTDGAIYRTSGCTTIQPLRPDISGPDGPERTIGPASGCRYGYEGGHLFRIGEHYVLTGTDWCGTDLPLEGRKGDGTYDTWYCTARAIDGPYSEPRLMIPHSGALFQKHDGQWMAACFGNGNGDISAPLPCRIAIIPVHVENQRDDLVIRVSP